MYPASLVVITAVVLMLLYWAAFLLWAWRSGQFDGIPELRRRPLEDDPATEEERGGH